jgi:hypothetical protein
LNDLIAQTLEIIQQRAFGGALPYGGQSWGYPQAYGQFGMHPTWAYGQTQTFGVNPFGGVGYGMTPYQTPYTTGHNGPFGQLGTHPFNGFGTIHQPFFGPIPTTPGGTVNPWTPTPLDRTGVNPVAVS